jgi:hypothetical protein
MPPFWMLAVGAAVAYLVWSRPSQPQPLPPIPPIGPPGIKPLGMPGAASQGGPHPLTLLAILAAGGMIAFSILESRTPAPAPAPGPAPVVGLDLRGSFVGQDASVDAGVTAALLAEIADVLEYDGAPTSGAEPRLRTGAQFDDLRRSARELRCRGVLLGQKHPLARDAIAKYLDAAVGTDGGPVDAAGRAKWVAAYREIARAASQAAGVSR